MSEIIPWKWSLLLFFTSLVIYFYIQFMYTLTDFLSCRKIDLECTTFTAGRWNLTMELSYLANWKTTAKSIKCLFRQIINAYSACLIRQTSPDFKLNQRIQQKVGVNSKRVTGIITWKVTWNLEWAVSQGKEQCIGSYNDNKKLLQEWGVDDLISFINGQGQILLTISEALSSFHLIRLSLF